MTLGTFPNGIKPSPRPIPPLEKLDPFAGGYKFAFLAVQQLPQQMSIIDKLRRLITRRDMVCVVVGRNFRDCEQVDIGAIEHPECTQSAIIDSLGQLTKQFNFDEVYTDRATAQWLTANQYWSKHCEVKAYDMVLLALDRHIDPAIRQLGVKAPFERGEIGLVPELRTKAIEEEVTQRIGDSVLCDALDGLYLASLRYR